MGLGFILIELDVFVVSMVVLIELSMMVMVKRVRQHVEQGHRGDDQLGNGQVNK